jgi:ADP-ribose pyrophosphatase YjhB (NUDIX family)
MLIDAHAKRAKELDGDAQLIVDRDKAGVSTYITIGHKPPELVIGRRKLWGVFVPVDSQDPVASFFDQEDAMRWADNRADSAIREIDADAHGVQVAVAALIIRNGKALFGRLKGSGVYVLPEATLEISESLESAARRAAKMRAGIEIGRVSVSKLAPYINTYIEQTKQHYITLCMVGEYVSGEPRAVDPDWEACGWFDADKPPEPLFVTVKQIIFLASRGAAKTKGRKKT